MDSAQRSVPILLPIAFVSKLVPVWDFGTDAECVHIYNNEPQKCRGWGVSTSPWQKLENVFAHPYRQESDQEKSDEQGHNFLKQLTHALFAGFYISPGFEEIYALIGADFSKICLDIGEQAYRVFELVVP